MKSAPDLPALRELRHMEIEFLERTAQQHPAVLSATCCAARLAPGQPVPQMIVLLAGSHPLSAHDFVGWLRERCSIGWGSDDVLVLRAGAAVG